MFFHRYQLIKNCRGNPAEIFIALGTVERADNGRDNDFNEADNSVKEVHQQLITRHKSGGSEFYFA